MRLKLQTYAATEPPNALALLTAIDVAARVLSEASENGVDLGLQAGEINCDALSSARDRLSEQAWDGILVGEAPFGSIHPEHSGWGLPSMMAPATPWILAAIDVLDWLAAVVGPADHILVLEDE